jgi:hypothetical protein
MLFNFYNVELQIYFTHYFAVKKDAFFALDKTGARKADEVSKSAIECTRRYE